MTSARPPRRRRRTPQAIRQAEYRARRQARRVGRWAECHEGVDAALVRLGLLTPDELNTRMRAIVLGDIVDQALGLKDE